jgi:uncharacterized protein (TIGR04255 family)
MHNKLSKPPVTYVLAQVKISSIEKMKDYVPQLQDKIRSLFPHHQEMNISIIQWKEGQPTSSTLKQWHFMDKEKRVGIVLDKQNIVIHTSDYEQFAPLLESFETVLTEFNEILDISLFTRLGLRYINLIDDGLSHIDRGLQGFRLEDNEFKEDQFLARSETTQINEEGVVKIQATHIGDKKITDGIQNIFVPPDLSDVANVLSFKKHKDREPKGEFLILDIDHFSKEQGDFDVSEISAYFHKLQETIYRVFCQAVGKENLASWN